ncbi:tyrosine-type recombinase/integrase [Tundrisphaera lichenicola]|uniref:tyrosine-type recombinase/integrase n=1 Tax=Tundrisphaera lichenicola TaxID=2029860 RepID=UPI003EBFDFBE
MARPHKPSYFAARGSWRFTLNGRQRYICKGVLPDQKPARDGIPRVVWEEMDKLIRESEGRASAGSDPTVFWLVQTYLEWLENEASLGKITRSHYLRRCDLLRYLTDYLGGADIRPAGLSPEWADDFVGWLRSGRHKGGSGLLSAHYVHDVGAAVRAMLRWASRPVSGRVPARLIPSNPLEGYGWPRQPGAVRGYVEAATVRGFLRWAWGRARWESNDRGGPGGARVSGPGGSLRPSASTVLSLKRRFDRIFVLLLRFQRLTGCRPGEASGLRWDEISPAPKAGVRWEPQVITIRPDRVKTRHQTDRARKIYVTDPVARLLRALERLPGRHPEVVFPHMRGTGAAARGELDPLAGEPWPSGSAASAKLHALRKAAIEAGVSGVEATGPTKLVAYANRHGYASEGASLGFSDEQIAEQLGNSAEVLRKVYAHTIEDRAAERAREITRRRRERRRPAG